jgi:hypothetical protein
MECRHIFPNGKRCRCRAVNTHLFCRYHAPQPRPRTLRPHRAGLGSWRSIKIHLATLSRSEVPAATLTLLSALLEDGPRTLSDRRAGALLRALMRRIGSVPFSLPDDPAPEPDWAFEFSRSIERVFEIIDRTKSGVRPQPSAGADRSAPSPSGRPLSTCNPLTQPQPNQQAPRTPKTSFRKTTQGAPFKPAVGLSGPGHLA